MKLKKIAALALAGMMAVSMLAACSDKTTTDNEEENNIVAAADAAAYANDALSAELKEYITVKTSTTLDGWVKDIATDTSKFGSNDIAYTYDKFLKASDNGTLGTPVSNHLPVLRKALKEKVVDSNVVYTELGSFVETPVKGSDTRTTSLLYIMSGMLDEKTAVQSVVDYAITSSNMPDVIGTDAGNYKDNSHNCDYDVEISALRVANDSNSGKSAWVIGMVITQTATKVANVEA